MDSLLIEVHCPIALKQDKTKPNGVEKKSFSLNLFDTICPYIIKGSDSTLPSSSPNDLLTPVRDLELSSSTIASPINNNDIFSFNFSLSVFRKEVMKQGLALMPRSYKGKIGITSKLFCNQRYNEHSWNPIESTDQLHNIIMTEHGTKGRIVGSSLKLRMAIGYTTKDAINDENSQYFVEENCLLYSQKPDLPKSPEPILTSSEIKSQNWDVACHT